MADSNLVDMVLPNPDLEEQVQAAEQRGYARGFADGLAEGAENVQALSTFNGELMATVNKQNLDLTLARSASIPLLISLFPQIAENFK